MSFVVLSHTKERIQSVGNSLILKWKKIRSIGQIQGLEGVVQQGGVTHLDLSYNAIEDISDLFKLVNLESIDVSHNNIKQIPDNVFKLAPNLKYIKCGFNPISDIPDCDITGVGLYNRIKKKFT